MTISATQVRKTFTGDGSTKAFTYNYRFLANGDLKVYQEGTLKTITTHYTVSGAGDAGGGTVTFLTAPALNDEIVIVNDPSATQTLDLVDNDSFPPESLESALDKQTLLIQRLKDRVDRSVVLADTDTATATTTLPTPVSNNLLAWNLAATALQNVDPNSLGTLTIGAGSITADLLAATQDLTGKTVTVATAAGTDSDTSVASTAMVQAAITARTASESAPGISELATAAEFITGTDASRLPPVKVIRDNLLVRGATVATTSGTSNDYTGIPAWAKHVIVVLNSVSTNGSDQFLLQLGDAGGIETSGYVASISAGTAASNATNGFLVAANSAGAASLFCGAIHLFNVSGNTWICSGTTGPDGNAVQSIFNGSKTLSDTLTQLRLTTGPGTNTFDGGGFTVICL